MVVLNRAENIMIITVIDNNINFSNQLLEKLKSDGYCVEYFTSIGLAIKKSLGDIYLLSTDFSQTECTFFIEKFKSKTIILMASTYSEATVRNPLNYGAKDYVVKPFHIEELEQKIDNFRLKLSIDSYQTYSKNTVEDSQIRSVQLEQLNPPVIIYTNYINHIDKLVMEYCQKKNRIFSFIALGSKDWKLKIGETSLSHFIYLSNLQLLSIYDTNELFRLLKHRKFIISTTKDIKTHYKVVKLNSEMQGYDGSYIMSVEEYIQFIIKNFQYKMTDTELAKQLNFSRKTLYDRRNKHNIHKMK